MCWKRKKISFVIPVIEAVSKEPEIKKEETEFEEASVYIRNYAEFQIKKECVGQAGDWLQYEVSAPYVDETSSYLQFDIKIVDTKTGVIFTVIFSMDSSISWFYMTASESKLSIEKYLSKDEREKVIAYIKQLVITISEDIKKREVENRAKVEPYIKTITALAKE